MTEFAQVGRSILKPDAYSKVQGKALYTDDLQFIDQLYVKILRSPIAHARITKIDTTNAQSLPGVKAVLCYQNCPEIKYNSYWREPVDDERLPPDQVVFGDTVRHVGDRVAAVAATSLEIAEAALNLIEVEYEELATIFNPIEALESGAPRIHPEGNLIKEVDWSYGDLSKGLSEADVVMEDDFETQIVQHASMETHTYAATYDQVTKQLCVWSSTQGVHNIRVLLGKLLNMSLNKIRVIQPTVGGGFGGKNDLFEEIVVALLAQETGRPVKLVFTREEEFIATRTRHANKFHLKIGVKSDGRITVRELTAYVNAGAYATASAKVTLTTGHRWLMLYNTENARYKGYCAYTNLPVAGAFRGFGTPQQSFANEVLLDRIADKIGIDPLELRIKNLVKTGDYDPTSKITIESCGLEDCLRQGAEAIEWYEKRGKRIRQGSKVRGVGCGVGTHNSGVKPFVNELGAAFVKLNEDGSLNVIVGAIDIGQGSDTVMSQIAAEIFGIDSSLVKVFSGDSDICPYDMGTHSSRQTYVTGNAVKLAAEEAREQFLMALAEAKGLAQNNLYLTEGQVWDKVQAKAVMTISEAAMLVMHNPKNYQIMGRGSFAPVTNAPPFLAHFAEVEVDTETGEVKVLQFIAVHDIGLPINPLLVSGQIEGGVVQGIGCSMSEEMVFDQETGQILNPNFIDYKLPSAMDIPQRVHALVAKTHEPTGPFGAKGLGEPVLVGVAPAIVNAIRDAVGVEINTLPITSEKVLKAIKGQY